MQRTRVTVSAAALTAAAALLAGCGGAGQDEDPHAGHGPAQQEQGQQHPPGHGEQPAQGEQPGHGEHNDADVEFLSGMIPHHQQAVQMSEMAQGRTDNPQVLDLAGEILAAQGPEIEQMSGWLTEWGIPQSDGGGHGESGEQTAPEEHGMAGHEGHGEQSQHGQQSEQGGHEMHGMLTPDQMRDLQQANGGEFDELYLSLMIEHHEGAVDMAGQELDRGAFAPAKELAQRMIDAQRAEIDEMQQLLQP
ncbi:DUF305 domain-containing protein [Saccharopolyspora sp. HNM0983]|uniref:DUF305 domain-containing protein n=1 Tax=Saccharopolyspora montiporae TaxID=2781240 RepID=A0A929BBT7_9PSEU|nr:DUF305 domain-containing protein [Saccharopolyspora sp. HNM0983]MBE9375961.1 DUF305 domain-containing protein [Saccharopolyspora sp. HNM0983]